jgi:hypothetical protein
MLLPSPTQDLQVSNSSVGTASTRPHFRMRQGGQIHGFMPSLPVVRRRTFRVSEHTSQVAGALIPDNTQQAWREYVRAVSNYRGEDPCSS